MQAVLIFRNQDSKTVCRWNPAVEQQAQDRIHRLGQFKPIAVHRFIIAGTIEERILKLQVLLSLLYRGFDHEGVCPHQEPRSADLVAASM